jgi:hypothetical protein
MPTGCDELTRIAQLESDNDTLRRKLEEAERVGEWLSRLLSRNMGCNRCPASKYCDTIDNSDLCYDVLLDYAKSQAKEE